MRILNFSMSSRARGGVAAIFSKACTTIYAAPLALACIKKITNTGSEAKTYVFDKHKVLAVTPDETSNEEPVGDNILLDAKLVTNLTVQPGESNSNPGCIIKHALTSNPQSLAYTSSLVDLIYQIYQSQPVSMIRVPGNNATALVINAHFAHREHLDRCIMNSRIGQSNYCS